MMNGQGRKHWIFHHSDVGGIAWRHRGRLEGKGSRDNSQSSNRKHEK